MRTLCLFVSSFLATHAIAVNFSDGGFGNYAFLAQSALGKCAEKNGRVFTSTLLRALEQASDGSIVEWRNVQTGSFGKIQVLKDPDGISSCRLARIAHIDTMMNAKELYQFCKKDGKWIASAR